MPADNSGRTCRACGDPVPETVRANGLIYHPKCHCRECFLELTLGEVPAGTVSTMDTRTGGGRRVLHGNKNIQ